MNEGTNITEWMQAKRFPFLIQEAKAYKWYGSPADVAYDSGLTLEEAVKLPKNPFNPDPQREEVEYPNHVALELKCNAPHSLELDDEIVQWVQQIFGSETDVGVFDDREVGGPVTVDVYVSWNTLRHFLEK